MFEQLFRMGLKLVVVLCNFSISNRTNLSLPGGAFGVAL